ncbi:DUF4625 domain-containing protein [Algoriphagus sp. NG3]|uniref:DUF4625 domain-containing protein n=1 Tax=Algoriphagus sp. NG3 TaxID=3097546 RepID=UPI002A80453D|nr:DUF4625 domain-containing protein [Algoriphagus sp. NG3]WPR77226.1 DUF4625 domain-containing protein [Algoriphagus sp. NG3]
MKNKLNILLFALFATFAISSCEDDPEPKVDSPTIDNVEIGLNNNEIGVIGRDFHLNAEIVAGDKIDLVTVKIEPIAGETYAGAWSFELTWDQYKGVKNTNVHKHFDIPEDAVEGRYDFLIIVIDENGSQLEEKRSITIYAPENLPVDPVLFELSVSARNDGNRVLYILSLGGYRDPVTLEYGDYQVGIRKEEVLSAGATISGIKGDGKIYVLLINKKYNHLPESIDAIDFSKAVVVDVFEHKNMEQTERWSHMNLEREGFPEISRLKIGADYDNNSPSPSPISGEKEWESGDYYVGVIYNNSTYNMSIFHYMELEVNMDL